MSKTPHFEILAQFRKDTDAKSLAHQWDNSEMVKIKRKVVRELPQLYTAISQVKGLFHDQVIICMICRMRHARF